MDYRFSNTTYIYQTINRNVPSHPSSWTPSEYSTGPSTTSNSYTVGPSYLYKRVDNSIYEIEDPFPSLTASNWNKNDINWDTEDKVTWDELSPSLQELILRKIKWTDLHPSLQHRFLEDEKYDRENKRIEEWLWANRTDMTYFEGMYNGFPYYKIEQHFNNDPDKVLTTLYFVAGDFSSPHNAGHYKNGTSSKEFAKFIRWPEQYASVFWMRYSRQVLCSVGYVDWKAYVDKYNNTGMRLIIDSVFTNKADIKVRFYCMVIGIMDKTTKADLPLTENLNSII